MKFRMIPTLSIFILAIAAHAGMRHPIEDSAPESAEIQSTPVYSGTSYHSTGSSGRAMPDRMPSAAPQRQPRALPAQVNGPVPRAPGLPSANKLHIPGVHIPNAAGGDGLLRMKPESLSFKGGMNRAQLHSFLRNARAMKLPTRDYAKNLQAAEIARRYHAALNPTPYKSFRTAYSLSIAGIGEITDPPPAIHYQNMVKRIDSLFHGLEFHYPRAMMHLWELSESQSNAKPLQARDALFAGLMSMRAGWETPAYNLMAAAAAKGVDQEERYLKILWKELEGFHGASHVDAVVAKVNPARAHATPLEGDKASFAMAKRMLLEPHRAPLALNPAPGQFLAQIQSRALRERFQLLTLVGLIRSGQGSVREQAVSELKSLEAAGTGSIRQEARLALARAHLQSGAAAEARDLYKNVVKDGKNRLEVLAEQTFAEYLSGDYQDSLGKAVALQSPYFTYGFAPDVHLVEILSRKAMCDFGGAEAGVARFVEKYGRELAAIEALLAQGRAAGEFYEELVGYHAIEQPLRYQRYLLQLPAVMENQKAMNHALADLEKLDRLGIKQKIIERPDGWDSFSLAMRQKWAARAIEMRSGSAGSALREAAYMAKRLRHTFAQLELLDLDISTGSAKNYNLQSALNFPARKAPELTTEADKFHWPYEDEIWEDEIDFMRAKNPSKCAMAAKQ